MTEKKNSKYCVRCKIGELILTDNNEARISDLKAKDLILIDVYSDDNFLIPDLRRAEIDPLYKINGKRVFKAKRFHNCTECGSTILWSELLLGIFRISPDE